MIEYCGSWRKSRIHTDLAVLVLVVAKTAHRVALAARRIVDRWRSSELGSRPWELVNMKNLPRGMAFLLLGAAAVVSSFVPSWLGVLHAVGGLLPSPSGFPSAMRAWRAASRTS
jgi:hypothetical protein